MQKRSVPPNSTDSGRVPMNEALRPPAHSGTKHPERRFIAKFYDGEIEPFEWDALMDHLRTCDECSDHFENVAAVRRAASEEEVDDGDMTPLESRRLLELIHKRVEAEARGLDK